MEINVSCPAGEPFTLKVNGRLVAEVAVGIAETRDGLERQVQRARRLEALPKIIASLCKDVQAAKGIAEDGKTPDQKAKGFCEGLSDGLAGILVDHPAGPGVPPILPRCGAAYETGYGYGSCVRRLLEAVKAADSQ